MYHKVASALTRSGFGVVNLQVRERPAQLGGQLALEMGSERREGVDRLLGLRQVLALELREGETRERGGRRDQELFDRERGELLLQRLDVDVRFVLVSHLIAIPRALRPPPVPRRSPGDLHLPRSA